jgi:glycosyltransferase involved in cell wall biosynthesis
MVMEELKNLELLLQNSQKLSIIVCARNEEETIGPLLTNLYALFPKEIIVIENGSTDKTKEICQQRHVKCISYCFTLGHDVGRAIGAQKATGEVLLFLDADIAFQAEELAPFITACYSGADIALNNLNLFYTRSSMIDYVSMAKAFLNRALLLPHLGYSSLTAIPHAMKKEAAEAIGFEQLSVPPKAQAIAALEGLKIEHGGSVNVFKTNRRRDVHFGEVNEVENMILGDHLEALEYVQSIRGSRLLLSDTIRKRSFIDML